MDKHGGKEVEGDRGDITAREQEERRQERLGMERVWANIRPSEQEKWKSEDWGRVTMLGIPRAPDSKPGPLRWKFDGGRGAMVDENDRIVGYYNPPAALTHTVVNRGTVEEIRAVLYTTPYADLGWKPEPGRFASEDEACEHLARLIAIAETDR